MAEQSMKAVEFDGNGMGKVVDKPVPTPDKGWVVIAPVATGFCGTDLHIAADEFPMATVPIVPGHEFAGHITAVGEGVTQFQVGDWVGADPNYSCGECKMCAIGATNLCEDLVVLGITIAGSMAEYVAAPEDVVVKLDAKITELQGPLIEPLSCVLHALERVPGWSEQKMIIFGAGPIGLIATALAVDEGAAEVCVVDPQEGRHAMARDMGAHRVVANVSELGDEEFELALDASGHPAAIGAAIKILGKRGRLIQMGVAAPDATVEFNPFEVYAKELSITGSNSLAEQYENAAERMVVLGPKLEKLVTGSYRFDQVNEAMDAMRTGGPVKIQIHP